MVTPAPTDAQTVYPIEEPTLIPIEGPTVKAIPTTNPISDMDNVRYQRIDPDYIDVNDDGVSQYYSQSINGINISCFECYENDIRPTYTSSEGLCYEYIDYIYHFDPILERYGYEF